MKTKKTNPKKPTATPAKTKRAAAKSARAKGNAKRTEPPPPKPETPAARILAAIAEVERRNGNPPPPTCVPVDPSPVAGGVYAGEFLFAARGILNAAGFDWESAERSFREVAAGRLRLSGEVAAARDALSRFAGRVKTPEGWRNATENELPAPADEIAVQWEALRWDLLEAVAALYRECAEAERAGVARSAIERALGKVCQYTNPPDEFRIPEEVPSLPPNGFLSPDWVRDGGLTMTRILTKEDVRAVLEEFEKVFLGLCDSRALFREEIYAGEMDATLPASPSNQDAEADKGAKDKGKTKSTKPRVPKGVLDLVADFMKKSRRQVQRYLDGTTPVPAEFRGFGYHVLLSKETFKEWVVSLHLGEGGKEFISRFADAVAGFVQQKSPGRPERPRRVTHDNMADLDAPHPAQEAARNMGDPDADEDDWT